MPDTPDMVLQNLYRDNPSDATKTLYSAHGGDASKADRAWAKRPTADHAGAPCC